MSRRLTHAQAETLLSKPNVRARDTNGRELDISDLGKPNGRAPGRAGDNKAESLLFELLRAAFPREWVEREFIVETLSYGQDGPIHHNRRVDVALPHRRICIEADGWSYHGRFPSAFTEHTERQNELMIAGWHPLRYTRGMVNDYEAVVHDVFRMIKVISGKRTDARVPGHCSVCTTTAHRWVYFHGLKPEGNGHVFCHEDGLVTRHCATCRAELLLTWCAGAPTAVKSPCGKSPA